MWSYRGKRAAFVCVAAGAAVLLALLFAVSDRLLVVWDLWRLGPPDGASPREEVIERLVDRGAAGLTPWIFRRAVLGKMSTDEMHSTISRTLKGPGRAPQLTSSLRSVDWPFRASLYLELRALRVPSEYPDTIVRDALQDRDARVRRWGVEAAGESEGLAEAQAGRLEELQSDPDPDVRNWASIVLRRLHSHR
jgi:hypothetical protein